MKENLNKLYIKANQYWSNAADFLCSLLAYKHILLFPTDEVKLTSVLEK